MEQAHLTVVLEKTSKSVSTSTVVLYYTLLSTVSCKVTNLSKHEEDLYT